MKTFSKLKACKIKDIPAYLIYISRKIFKHSLPPVFSENQASQFSTIVEKFYNCRKYPFTL
ncbi:hypothetical protein DWW47_14460 [Odoribacter splanchnicus]|uniref:Uncharacterized protein n=1 Tax=Odoribacter splanchnicus TaxID=28118 RepID=A0A1Y3ZYD6_9BACT|nr:MAG: hypothetical protein BHV82_05820 [Odoribacter sp. 43_10]OUN95305.1 hypothetical protein B5F99_11285 [Odoribacter splanchnicus]OUO12510.1 hypothetical protein B5F93_14310 [Odoribacter splanchnicus]RGU55853.1 hypothetical protein DWW57_11215 [Odoribacter splanchnicus]RGU74525.1 hypothetical protein DWW47_14460 [Odoribacter splanchnicus]